MGARNFFAAGALVAVLTITNGCGSSSAPPASINAGGQKSASSSEQVPQQVQVTASTSATSKVVPPPVNLHPRVVIRTSAGDVMLKLNAEKAPRTVHNFLENYAGREFYNGTIIHYVDPGRMIAAGGYTADLQPKPTRAEIRNESFNKLSNVRGTIAMARHPDYPDSATSQFFFNLSDNTYLDYQDGDEPVDGYCVFGEVIDGFDVLEKIAGAQVQDQGEFPQVPVQPVTIRSVERVEN